MFHVGLGDFLKNAMGVKDKTDENAGAEWGEEQREPSKNNHQKLQEKCGWRGPCQFYQ